MTDDTVYAVIDTVDAADGGTTSSFYEGGVGTPYTPAADDTTYSYVNQAGVEVTDAESASDDTAYTGSSYEAGAIVASVPGDTTDNSYTFTDGLDQQASRPSSSFYEHNSVYEALVLAPSLLEETEAARDAAVAAQAAAEAAVATVDVDAAVLVETNNRIAADNALTSAFQAADTVVTNAFQAADTVVTNAFQAADAVVTSAFAAADTALQGTLNTAIGLKANTASPTFTGTPAAPTATAGTNTTQLATTAFVEAARVILASADATKAPLASPTFTGVPAAPTASPGTNTTQLATTAFTAAAIAAAAGVTSIDTATGALTLGAGLTRTSQQLKINAGHVPAVASNSAASAGEVGEYKSSQTAHTGWTNGLTANMTSLSLEAGEWEIEAIAYITGAGATVLTNYALSISPTTATLTTSDLGQFDWFRDGSGVNDPIIVSRAGRYRVNLTSTTTYYAVFYAAFSNVLNVTVKMVARRPR